MTWRSGVVLILMAAMLSSLHAGTTGKIAGRVVDATTKEPLVGVNIILEGTSLGAATNIDGQYIILNIQPKSYTLTASLLGYSSTKVTNVQVSIDQTTTVNVELRETVLEQQEVVVVAERPLIQPDLTAKTAVIGNEEIAVLPITEVAQILNLQAGFVSGSLRGGRKGEVAYWIDGVPVTDVYDGTQIVEVNKNVIQELQVISGAFNAEYGQALSGVVNIATKEGGQKFSGGFGYYGGDYYSTDTKIFRGADKFNPGAIRNFEGNISGPVYKDEITFFGTGRYIYFDGWLNGIRRFNPQNTPTIDFSTGAFKLYRDPQGVGDNEEVSLNWSERWYGQGKLTWRLSSLFKLNYNFIYDRNVAKRYNRDYLFNPDGIGNEYNTSYTNIAQLTHTVSGSTFYTVGASKFDKHFKYYLYEDSRDPRYVHPDLLRTIDSYSFKTGGTDLNRFDRITSTKLVKADLSTQLDQTNLVKAGVEFRWHDLFFENVDLRPIQSQAAFDFTRDNPFITTQVLPLSSPFHDKYKRKPKEFSAYLQDKLEFTDFILNIGLRFDYFDPDGIVLADPSDPNVYDPRKPNNRFDDINGNGKQDPGERKRTDEERRAYWYKNASAKSQFSPRIGASFPITARGAVHFSYGHFFQIPRFERLYENPEFKVGQATNLAVVGNADLEPEETINGEIGIQQQLTDDISVDLTVYLRDIRNLTGTRSDEIVVFGGSASYTKYVNSDFGLVKGIVLTIDQRLSGGFSTSLDYTFQVARGSASDPQATRNALAGGELPEVQLTSLDWDQRHTLNITAAYNTKDWGISFIGQYGSGTPYTPRRSTDITTLLTNSQLKPVFFNLDGRAFYEVQLDALKLVFFTRIFNILDIRNESDVFRDTGRAGFTTDEAQARAQNTPQLVNSISEWYIYPKYYSEPRRIEFGMNLEF